MEQFIIEWTRAGMDGCEHQGSKNLYQEITDYKIKKDVIDNTNFIIVL